METWKVREKIGHGKQSRFAKNNCWHEIYYNIYYLELQPGVYKVMETWKVLEKLVMEVVESQG